MAKKEGRQASHQMAAENSNQRGKAQKAAPARHKGRFYLILAAWWPTAKGQKWLARKGIEKRLEALEESQNCAAKVERTTTRKATHDVRWLTHACDSRGRKMEMRLGHPLGFAAKARQQSFRASTGRRHGTRRNPDRYLCAFYKKFACDLGSW